MKLQFIPIARGDVSEMMLDGTLCQCCGVFIGSDAGYPVSCEDCEDDQ